MLIDSHAHLDFVDDLKGVLDRAKKAGVSKVISIGTNLEESKKAIEIAEKNSSTDLQIFTSCGVHPQDGKDDVGEGWIDNLKSIATSDKVIAIGECGLDYYLPGEKRVETVDKDKEFQRETFVEQIKLADDLNLPLIIHCRNGWGEIFDLLTSNSQRQMAKGVFHSWTGDWDDAQKALNLGFYISFSGIVTFKNAGDIQDVAKQMPLDRVLIETDSPFLAPEPSRGQKNEPKNVRIVADFLARIRNQSVNDISAATSANAQKLFSIL